MRLIHVAVAAFALGISSAHAGEIIDFSAKILDIKGGEIPRENPKPGPDGKMLQAPALTLADVCEVSLLDDGRSASRGQPMQGVDPAEKLRRFQMAVKIETEKKFPLSSDESTWLKSIIGSIEPTWIFGQASVLLDPPPNKVANKP
jgi:hypothetical protein